jgi:hypothetical protein
LDHGFTLKGERYVIALTKRMYCNGKRAQWGVPVQVCAGAIGGGIEDAVRAAMQTWTYGIAECADIDEMPDKRSGISIRNGSPEGDRHSGVFTKMPNWDTDAQTRS